MLKVLVNAYACCPGMGSEQGMGWNWISRISQFCEVYVITESEYKNENQSAIRLDSSFSENCDETNTNKYGLTKEQCARIHFYFVNIGKEETESIKIRKMCWNQGTWSFYPKYAKWQEKALDIANYIIKEQELTGHGIDVMHQLNMAGFREPGMLYKINDSRKHQGKNHIPLVWGPMTGYDRIPLPFMIPGGLKFTAFYQLKNILNFIQLIGHHRVRKMIRKSDKLIGATPEMKQGIEKYYGVSVEHINETGCDDIYVQDVFDVRDSSDKFKIIWVGRFIYTKQLDLALRTIKKIRNLNIEFHIVGKAFEDEDTERMHNFAECLGINEKCVWHGQIPHEEVLKLMRQSDVFFFTSVFEATSTVIMEAIQCGLPIVCFNRCGFGPIVDEKIGIKVSCLNPQKAVDDFAEALSRLYNDRKMLAKMSVNCKEKQHLLSWSHKIESLKTIYENL